MRMVRTEILHELPPPMLIDMALVVAAAAEDAVPVAAISMAVDVPMSMFDISILENKVFEQGEDAGMPWDWEACSQKCAFAERQTDAVAVTEGRDVNTKNGTHSSENEGQADYYKQQDRNPQSRSR